MMPMNSDDVHLYGEFTALKRNGLQTWIAIGGVRCSSHFTIMLLIDDSGVSMILAPQPTTLIVTWSRPKPIGEPLFNRS